MKKSEIKYIFAPLLAGIGAGIGISRNMIFQFTAIGGIIGLIIDRVVSKIRKDK